MSYKNKTPQEYQKEWRLKNPEKCRAAYERRKQRWNTFPELKKERLKGTFASFILKNYGITLEQRDKIIEDQNNLCPICGLTSKKFCIDHCHKTKKFRGIICDNCNKAIGHIKDNPKVAIKIHDYLERFR